MTKKRGVKDCGATSSFTCQRVTQSHSATAAIDAEGDSMIQAQDRVQDSSKKPPIKQYKRVVVVLIKPTHYDDNGFPHRYLRGVLPSNSLAVMHSLTRDALERLLPATLPAELHTLEDGIRHQARKLSRLHRRFPEQGTLLIVGFVAVQTAQFPRAVELIARWQRVGATCVIGGFHVSGSITTLLDGIKDKARPDIPCPHVMPQEVQSVMDHGTIVFHGEAEEQWADVLSDILQEKARTLYRGGQPSLERAPLPEFPAGYFKRSFVTEMGTFDAGRGCPFTCSFCSIINVQGRTQRFRSPESILRRVLETCTRRGKSCFFFTDDNFARHPRWNEILTGLAELRKQGHEIVFMIEADLKCGDIPGFLECLAAAGCTQIFMGVESMNQANLIEASKRQNKVSRYRELWRRCHDLGMQVHAAYIVGFPHDTPASLERDVEALFECGSDQASFFILTPIPGSEDHVRAVAAGVQLNPDLSQYDSFHVVMNHGQMSRREWFDAYARAWRQFYRVENMIAALRRCKTKEARLNLMRNYVWYRWSFATEQTHPMIAGFYRVRNYSDRRQGAPHLGYVRFLLQEGARHVRYLCRLTSEFYRFQHVVFETELAPLLAGKRSELSERMHGFKDWTRLTFGRAASRRWLNRFWTDYARQRWHLLINPWAYRWHLKLPLYATTEVIYTLRFALMLPQLVRRTTN